MTVNTDQACTADSVMACPPVAASLGMRLIGDEEVATITLTQHDQAVILHCADQAHAARIAAAIEALPAAPAVQGEPVGEVRLELGTPSVVYGELYNEAAPHLVPGTLLYAAPPAPDVAELVEALEEIEQWVGRWCADNHPVVRFARKALDAHRGRGGEA